MKKLLAIFILAAATCRGVDVSYRYADLTWTGTGATRVASFVTDPAPDYAARWTFDEMTGTQALDSVASLPAVFKGTTKPAWTNGVSGGALYFNGSTAYADCGDVMDMRTNNFTVAFWMRTTEGAGSGSRAFVVKSKFAAENGRWGIQRENATLNIQSFLAPLSTLSHAQTNQLNGAWHHVVVTWTRAGNQVAYYDGVQRGALDISAQNNADMNTADSLFFGVYNDSTGSAPQSGYYFTGSLDDIRIYNRALSSNEVFSLKTKWSP